MPGGHVHSHSHGRADTSGSSGTVAVSTLARVGLTLFLVLAAAATVYGLVRLWPGDTRTAHQVASTDFAAPGVTFPVAVVQSVLPPCEGPDAQTGAKPADGQTGEVVGADATCGAITVQLEQPTPTSGDVRPVVSVSVPPAISSSGLREGDTVQLLRVPPRDGNPESYSFLQVQRGAPLSLMLVLFVVVVALIARWRGILALVGLAFGGLVLVKFMLPALLGGTSGLLVALVGCSAIMFVVLYLAHGLSVRTSTALAGTLFGVGITAGLGVLAVDGARLSGVANDEGATLASFIQTMDPKDLLTCAIIVAGLGVLNDVTITQSSAVWELRAAAPHLGRRELFRSGMRIGRDHIASTIYTIVFAYAGAALPVLLLLFLYERPVLDMLQTESISEEIVRTLASAIGLVLAVPVTTLIAALTVGGARAPSPAGSPVPTGSTDAGGSPGSIGSTGSHRSPSARRDAPEPAGPVPSGPGGATPSRGRVPARAAAADPAGRHPRGVADPTGRGSLTSLPTAADLQRAAEGPPPPRTRAEARARMSD